MKEHFSQLPYIRVAFGLNFLKFLLWSSVLALGLLLLTGRYDWENAPDISRIGYVCSAALFVVFTPSLYFFIKELTTSEKIALIVTMAWWVIATLPYKWLGLDKYYYSLDHASIIPILTQPDWFPNPIVPSIPREGLIFGSLIFACLALFGFLWVKLPQFRKPLIAGIIFSLIVIFQTWLHLSHRSPYVYVPFYEQEPSTNAWFLMYLFPDGKGAVNLDVPTFRAIEYIFMGKPAWSNMFIRRSFLFYLTSQFTYFVNPYYIFLFANILIWFSSIVTGWFFTQKFWSKSVAFVVAGLIATGSGFIMFVAQPLNYLAGYASIILLIFFFEKWVVNSERPNYHAILFGAMLGLASLNYDLFQFYLCIIGYGLIRKVRVTSLAVIVGIATAIYFGFLWIFTGFLGQTISTTNSQFATEAVTGVINLLKSRNFGLIYTITRAFWGQYFLNLGNAFFVIPALCALCGVLLLREKQKIWIIFLLLLPSILLQAILQYGGSWIYTLPRLVYVAYPAIYILAGIFIDRLSKEVAIKGYPKAAKFVPVLFLIGIFILNNIDVWGYPTLYYHFYWSTGPEWLNVMGN